MTKMVEQIRVGGTFVESPRGVVPFGKADEVYNKYLEGLQITKQSPLGDVVRTALAASDDPRFKAFLEMALSDRRNQGNGMSLAAMANLCQIALIEFQAFWRSVRTNEAIDIATNALPSLTKDLVDDAKSDESTCPMCDGTGQIQREGKPDKICPNCAGKGVIRTIGDKHARKQLLEMTGAIKKEAPVQVNLNMRGVGMEAAAARLNKAVPFDLDVTSATEESVDTDDESQ